MAAGGSKYAVLVALGGNITVTVVKFAGFLVTGSGVLLSESIHSLADVFNQFLLYIGVKRAGRGADDDFEFGYEAEQYVWALISAVGIFFLGCGITGYHGVQSLLDQGHEISDLSWAVGILVFSFFVEGLVLIVVIRAIREKAAGKPFFTYLRREADPSLAAVFSEDAAACLGVIIALLAIFLTHLTGEHYWDAIGSILISLLLGSLAIWLIFRNHKLLVGLSIPARLRKQIRDLLQADPAVEEIVDLRTRILDAETYRIKAELRFDGSEIAKKMRSTIEEAYPKIQSLEDFEAFLVKYSDELVDLVGDEIDRIEKSIQKIVPEAKHLDIEAD